LLGGHDATVHGIDRDGSPGARQLPPDDRAAGPVERRGAPPIRSSARGRPSPVVMAALRFALASFNAVVAANVLHPLPDLERALTGLRRRGQDMIHYLQKVTFSVIF
jgi:hypothetical protein